MRKNAAAPQINLSYGTALLACVLLTANALHAQQKPAAPVSSAAPAAEVAPAASTPLDPMLSTAAELVDHVLFLRCFCVGEELKFDTQGKPLGSPKTADWTLAAVKLDHASRKGPGELQLDGIRVIYRFNADRSEFEQHPQKDAKVRLLIAENGNGAALSAALDRIVSFGIDPALQRSMPPYWSHYFNPQTPWPSDGLGDNPGQVAAGAPPINQPAVTHKQSATFTTEAQHDHITGSVQLHFIVDTAGAPRRLYLTRPLGYGLDERAVEATEKMRFTPATEAGKPVPAPVSMTQDFVLLPPAAAQVVH